MSEQKKSDKDFFDLFADRLNRNGVNGGDWLDAYVHLITKTTGNGILDDRVIRRRELPSDATRIGISNRYFYNNRENNSVPLYAYWKSEES